MFKTLCIFTFKIIVRGKKLLKVTEERWLPLNGYFTEVQMDHSTLSIKKRGKYIPANQRLYIKEASPAKNNNTYLPDLRTELTVRVDWSTESHTYKPELSRAFDCY